MDEFQDTSLVQWDILRPIAEEAMGGKSTEDTSGSFFCVGDSKQAIYRFRGTTPGFMGRVSEYYGDRLLNADLDINRRSDKNIVEFNNKLFSDADSYVKEPSLPFNFLPQKASSNNDGFVKVSIIEGELEPERTQMRKKLLEDAVLELLANGFKADDIAIIVSRKEKGREAMRFLKSKGINATAVFSESLSAKNSFRIISALVMYMYSRLDFYLIEFLFTYPSVLPLDRIHDDAEIARYRTLLIKHFNDVSSDTVFSGIFSLKRELSLKNRLSGELEYNTLFDIISGKLAGEYNPIAFLDKFKKEAALAKTDVSVRSENSPIPVFTVHGVKGLQFPAVILYRVREGFLPGNQENIFLKYDKESSLINISGDLAIRGISRHYTQYAPADYSETLAGNEAFIRYEKINLLYVAATRACNALYIFVDPSIRAQDGENTESYIAKHYPESMSIGVLPVIESKRKSKPAALGLSPALRDILRLTGAALKAGGEASAAFEKKLGKEFSAGTFAELADRAKRHIKACGTVTVKRETAFQEPFAARSYGLLFHAAVSALSDFKPEFIQKAVSKGWKDYGAYLTEADRVAVINDLQILLNNEEVMGLIRGRKLFREKPTDLRGRVVIPDLYAVGEEDINLLDFKTSSPNNKRTHEYEEQLSEYSAALKTLYPLPVTSYLIFIHAGRVTIKYLP
jgi:ATP-dependent exoDNAse (exonuclease V) beta subunit